MPRSFKKTLELLRQLAGLIQMIGAVLAAIIGGVIWLIHTETRDVHVDLDAMKSQVAELRKDVSEIKSEMGIPPRTAKSN